MFVTITCLSPISVFPLLCFYFCKQILVSRAVLATETHSAVDLVCLHVLGHTSHQGSELSHDRLNQLLPVSVILPELGEYVILFAGVLHLLQKRKGCVRIHTKVLGGWLSIVSEVSGPVPNHKQVKELSKVNECQLQGVPLKSRHRLRAGKQFTLYDI